MPDVPSFPPPQDLDALLRRAKTLKSVVLSPVSTSDVELFSAGALAPLTGFLIRKDYERVVDEMRLADGSVWSIPITLPVTREQATTIREGEEIALIEPGGRILATMTVVEKFDYDKRREARSVFRTEEEKHPGVARLYQQGDVYLGGPVQPLQFPGHREFIQFRHTPAETRRMFERRGWKTVVGFQTRNPVHRSHEYIQKTALEIVDGLLLHPLVGETKADDIPADVRMASYQSLLRDYYPPDRVILGVFPAAMRYAGPREAIFHALCRKNYGCTHFIVGRDHAGVGNYYGTYDAQKIFDNFTYEELGIMPLFFENTFYCKKCGAIVSAKTCPHDSSYHLVFSGTEVRRRLEAGEPLPPEFTRPEVSRVLIEGLKAKREGRDVKEVIEHVTPTWGGRKVFVIGLDCAPPEHVFEAWRNELPNLNKLMSNGVYGKLRSCVPCITVPAWSVMTASKDPGQLGIYGFRNRADRSYDKMSIATGSAVKEDRVWDILSRAGKHVNVVGVPGTYPPRPVNGNLVACFLTPSTKSNYTHPAGLKDEIAKWVPEYYVDVPQFRTEDKEFLLKQIYDMTEARFTVVKHMIVEKPWDFFMFVEMGTDRINHGFWSFTDPQHWRYEPGNKLVDSIREYYHAIDRGIGEMLDLLPDDTVVLVVSDHGAKRMDGGVAINEWLLREGYLTLKRPPEKGIVPFEKVEVDWSKTKAWGSGGYYARIFMNVEGREPQGIIKPQDYERERDMLKQRIEAIPDDKGNPLPTIAFKPEDVYVEVKNIAPDLIVYFGDLYWRGVGSFGHGGIHTFENDTGPDDANHARDGIFIMSDPKRSWGGKELIDLEIMDVAPTILDLMGLPVPRGMRGKVITP
ncbi:MAG TPA: sulfate adenylyltransferase [Anaerolineae bacterium]